jgi:hypothetical protein
MVSLYFQVFLVFCKCFRRMLQIFELFRTYAASVSSRCCKSKLGLAHVAIRVRSGGGASGPRAQSGGAVRACKLECEHGVHCAG